MLNTKSAMIANEKQTVHAKKIANEPHLLSHWLTDKSKELDSDLANELEKVAQFITKAASMNQEAVEARARRKAMAVGLDASKGRKPYSDKNIGLFQLINPRTLRVVGGKNFNMSANEVIEYCNMINDRIFDHVFIPDELYNEDPTRYWEIKEDTVDKLYRKKLIRNYEDWDKHERTERDVLFSDEDVNAFYLSPYDAERLQRIIERYKKRVEQLECVIGHNSIRSEDTIGTHIRH